MRIPALTGLRGVAALWVVLFHYQLSASALGMRWFANFPIISSGWHGVDLFFLLSGFVLMLTHAADFKILKSDTIIAFLKMRAARVYPLSWIILLIILLIVQCDHGFMIWYQTLNRENYTLIPFIKTVFLANRWGFAGDDGDWNQPVWSLSVEILGYLLFPVVAWQSQQKSSLWRSISLTCFCLGILALIQVMSGTAGINKIGFKAAMIRMSLAFVAGVSLAKIVELCPAWLKRVSPALAVFSSATLIFISSMHIFEWAMTNFFAILIFSLASGKNIIRTLLSASIFMSLGRISFPLYLVHVTPLLFLLYNFEGIDLPNWLGLLIFIGYILTCLTLAFLLHIAVERPSHDWGRRWASKTLVQSKITSVTAER